MLANRKCPLRKCYQTKGVHDPVHIKFEQELAGGKKKVKVLVKEMVPNPESKVGYCPKIWLP